MSSRGGRSDTFAVNCENVAVVQCPGPNLTGAILTDVVSSGLLDTPASLPDGWTIIDGRLTPA